MTIFTRVLMIVVFVLVMQDVSADEMGLLLTVGSPNEQQGGGFGGSISKVGDIDGDGNPDFIVNAPGESPFPGPTGAGRVHILSGSDGSSILTLSSPHEQASGHFGTSVSGIGDTNGDGFQDVVVGAAWEYSDSSPNFAGKAYLFCGSTGDLIHEFQSPNEIAAGHFGSSVSGTEDVDGDGCPDILVGAPFETGPGPDHAGLAYIFSGATGTLLRTLQSPNPEQNGFFGSSVSGGGDLDGDGCPDIVVGACHEDPAMSPAQAGRAYVFSGTSGDLLYALLSPNEEENGNFGYAAAGVGDSNGDGLDDIIVGAPHEDPGLAPMGAGRAYIYTPGLLLWGDYQSGQIALTWTPIVPALAYWLYGANNHAYFEPGLTPPYEHRVAILSSGWDSYSIGNGIDEPDSNWTYVLVAVRGADQILAISNRVGEHDFELMTTR